MAELVSRAYKLRAYKCSTATNHPYSSFRLAKGIKRGSLKIRNLNSTLVLNSDLVNAVERLCACIEFQRAGSLVTPRCDNTDKGEHEYSPDARKCDREV
jgi:hypothetical protein